MKRVAILIGSPLTPDMGKQYLPGVYTDIKLMHRYLMSDMGGRWKFDEIKIAMNPSFSELQKIWNENTGNDYALVVFSGHGSFSTHSNVNILKINNTERLKYDKVMQRLAPRQLSILDSCKSLSTIQYADGGLGGLLLEKAFSQQRGIYDYDVRKVYDNIIKQQIQGCCTLHSAQIGEPSYAYPGNEGSYFTLALINSAKDWAERNNKPGIYRSGGSIVASAKEYLQNNRSIEPQVPYCENAHLKFPFVLSPITSPNTQNFYLL